MFQGPCVNSGCAWSGRGGTGVAGPSAGALHAGPPLRGAGRVGRSPRWGAVLVVAFLCWELVLPGGRAQAQQANAQFQPSVAVADGPPWSMGVEEFVQWGEKIHIGLAFLLLVVCGAVLLCIAKAARGMPIKVRRIAGLEAVEEAIGRATEMGRPCLFVPGIEDLNFIETVAGITFLGHVAQSAARHDATVIVPTTRSLVMTAAKEAVRAAHSSVGKAETYQEDNIYYVTDEQFGFVAYATGWMMRERPAACFYLGKFFAESLILAETGNAVGAMQIAGTTEQAQLPFFVAACDYTLIGEEFLAANAYLSGEPRQLGSLAGQDFGKMLAMVMLLVGSLVQTIVQPTIVAPGSLMHRVIAMFNRLFS